MQGIRLDQNAFQLQGAQQLFEGGPFTGFAGVVDRLGQGDTKGPCLDRHLGDKPVTAVLSLHRGAPQGLAVTHQLVKSLAPTCDLADHRGQQQLAQLLQVCLIEQVEKGGITGPAPEIQPQRLVQLLPMPPGKSLKVTRAAAATEDPQHRKQQQEPLWVAHPTAVAANSFGEG